MSNIKQVKISTIPQMFDINTDFKNFKVQYHVISSVLFKSGVVSQTQLDEDGPIMNDKCSTLENSKKELYEIKNTLQVTKNNEFEPYFLAIIGKQEGDASVGIKIEKLPDDEIIKSEEQEQIVEKYDQSEIQKKESLFTKLFNLRTIMYVIIFICAALLLSLIHI